MCVRVGVFVKCVSLFMSLFCTYTHIYLSFFLAQGDQVLKSSTDEDLININSPEVLTSARLPGVILAFTLIDF